MRRRLRLLVVGAAVLVPVAVAYASVDMTASPSSLSFPTQCTHSTTTTKPLTVTNNGDRSATNVTVSVSPSPMQSVFQLGGQTSATKLDPGSSMNVQVGFSPQHVGANRATAIVTFTDPGPSPSPEPSSSHGHPSPTATPTPTPTTGTISIPLGGNAIDRFIDALPLGVNFGSVHVGKPGPNRTLTIFDDGASPLTIEGMFLGGRQPGDFTVGTLSSSVVTDGHPATVTLGFHPKAAGARAAELVIRSNSCSGNLTVQLGGIAIEQDVTVSPKTVDFGAAVLGAKPTKVLSVINQGGAPLTLTSIQMLSHDPTTQDVKSFTLTGVPKSLTAAPKKLVLQPGKAVQLRILYDASQVGPKAVDIKIASNDPDTKVLTVPILAAALPKPTPSVSQSAVAPPPSKRGSGFNLHLGAYLPAILVALAIAAFFGLLVVTRRMRGIPE
jgi:HYDIN/CFA65/VesB family protein